MHSVRREISARVTKLKTRRIRRSLRPVPSLAEMLATMPETIVQTDEDREWDSMPAVGAERWWEPAQQRVSLAKRIALRTLVPKRFRRRPRIRKKSDDHQI